MVQGLGYKGDIVGTYENEIRGYCGASYWASKHRTLTKP